ncbi:MAG: hypothetical protein V2A67_10585 [Bacteroidota bacterium]
MVLVSDRLILTGISWEDLEDLHRLHSFPEVDDSIVFCEMVT